MRCNSDRRKIYRWLDGELEAPERRAFETHLKGCPACQKKVESLRGFHRMLQSTAPLLIGPSLDFESNFWKKAYARQHESRLSKFLKDIESLFPVPTFAHAVAILLLALLIGSAGGIVSARNIIMPQQLEDQRTSIQYLSGFREFKGIPSSSVAASYLMAVEERNKR